jgi:hypothetical protein
VLPGASKVEYTKPALLKGEPVRPRTDLEEVLVDSPQARRVLFALFILSLAMDFYLILLPSALWQGSLHSIGWDNASRIVLGSFEVAALIASTILYLAMFFVCMRDTERPFRLRVLWALVFILCVWYGAQVYYWFSYRRLLLPHEQPV